jgi:hypothetical protein
LIHLKIEMREKAKGLHSDVGKHHEQVGLDAFLFCFGVVLSLLARTFAATTKYFQHSSSKRVKPETAQRPNEATPSVVRYEV